MSKILESKAKCFNYTTPICCLNYFENYPLKGSFSCSFLMPVFLVQFRKVNKIKLFANFTVQLHGCHTQLQWSTLRFAISWAFNRDLGRLIAEWTYILIHMTAAKIYDPLLSLIET